MLNLVEYIKKRVTKFGNIIKKNFIGCYITQTGAKSTTIEIELHAVFSMQIIICLSIIELSLISRITRHFRSEFKNVCVQKHSLHNTYLRNLDDSEV